MITNADIITAHIQLMAHVEGLTEKHGFATPIDVSIADSNDNQFEFEYSPEADTVDIPAVFLVLPIRLTLTDANDTKVELQLPDLMPLAEWSKRFQQ